MAIYGQAGIPTRGWTVVEVIDRGKDCEELCQCCEERWVRFAHRISHPNYPLEMEVGCICAEALVQNYNGNAAQTVVANRAKRRQRLLSKIDPTHPKIGNDIIVLTERNGIIRAEVHRHSFGRFGYTTTPIWTGGPFLTKEKAFEAIVNWAIP